MKNKYIIIGGGFFGSYIATELTRHNKGSVVIIERETDLLQRASYSNQARIHKGYHYPRSLLTGLSSRVNFRKFIKDFKDCIYDSFEQYYAIANKQSKVTTPQFKTFCKRINAPLKDAPSRIKALFNKTLVQNVFLVEEYAFDAVKLKELIFYRLEELKIPVLLNTEALSILLADDPQFPLKVRVHDRISKKESDIYGTYVFNCTYSNINTILSNSGITKINLKQELTEMLLIEMPEHLKNIGITLMCGPFFSFMPFPPRDLHTLSHVRYTPHHYWHDIDVSFNNQDYFDSIPKETNMVEMIQDVKRYIPAIEECKYIDSLWELKTVLPQSEIDDGRPILLRKNIGVKNLICIMGGKIDNIYDLEKDLL